MIEVNKTLLLDTHILLWYVNQDKQLSKNILNHIENAPRIAISTMTCFEMAWLYHHGRIQLPCDYSTWFNLILEKTNIECIDVTAQIAHLAVQLPEHHKDPQDRLIIATALHYDLLLASMDNKFALYEVLNHRLVV